MEQHLQFCVYKITNSISGKSYIGKTCNLKRRWKCHTGSSKNKNITTKFPNALRKYQESSWNISILYETNDENHCYEVEALLVDKYDTFHNGYNSCGGGKGAGSGENNPNYDNKWNDEQKEHLSKLKTGTRHTKKSIKLMKKVKSKENHPMWNKSHTEESKELMRIKNSGSNSVLFGAHPSNKTLKLMSISQLGENNPIYGRPPWENPACKSKGLRINWFYLDKVYDLRTIHGYGQKRIYDILVKDCPDIKKSMTSFQNMFRWIEKNGNPKQNKDWLDFHSNYQK